MRFPHSCVGQVYTKMIHNWNCDSVAAPHSTIYYIYLWIFISGYFDKVSMSTWSEWWSYEGISGPNFWGLINPDWTLCSQGKYQSPIDIDPKLLLYDPNLRLLNVSTSRVSGEIGNTGHDLTFYLRHDGNPENLPLITGGPLTYRYRVHHLVIHFGSNEHLGSEHRIRGKAFPMEIQLLAYNVDLYTSVQQAMRYSFGITVLSLFGQQVKERSGKFFGGILETVDKLRYKGYKQTIAGINLGELVPNTSRYITYEGSLTHPGCQEVVTWVILNKPFYISLSQLETLRRLYKVDERKDRSKMENNFRPIMPLNNRTIRTNISPDPPTEECRRKRIISYEVNGRFLT